MADFSFLSDSDDEKAVNELLAQAMDQSVLEQVAAINCSGLTDSVLPTHLETRFRKLKSFPETKPVSSKSNRTTRDPSSSSSPSFKSQLPSAEETGKPCLENQSEDLIGEKSESGSQSDERNAEKSVKKDGLKPKSSSVVAISPSNSSEFSVGEGTFSPSKRNPDKRVGVKSKSKAGSFLSPSSSWDSTMEPPSPPKKTGCFWCSPKKDSRKTSKENRIAGIGLGWEKNWEINDVFLSELSTFSPKEQQKMLKKAIKEQEKINREAEKIVKWAKQASMRMDASDLDDQLSDNESAK